MKKIDYANVLGNVLQVLQTENIINEIDWTPLEPGHEILNIIVGKQLYSFEIKAAEELKITLDTIDN